MALYLIGDVQGCDDALQQLLEQAAFSPSRDTLVLLGDLVNRGPQSDAVLRRAMRLGHSARCVLGNHDLHLLAQAAGVRASKRLDTLDCVLQAPDREALLDWLRQQPLALHQRLADRDLLMVHAGVFPAWTLEQTLALAHEVECALRSSPATRTQLLQTMYGNQPDAWDDALQGDARLRTIVNALTRMRYCTPQGHMNFSSSAGLADAPAGCLPWFDLPGRKTADACIAFGHWSTLGWLDRSDVVALDSGCVWGGQLSAWRIATPARPGQAWDTELLQVPCAQCCAPGE